MNRTSIFLCVGILWSSMLICSSSASVLAGQGDTIKVQTVTFADTNRLDQRNGTYYLGGTYLFPSDTIRLEKISMYFKLKCVPGNYPSCGEWDFLAYVYAFKDSIRYELGRSKTPYGFGLDLGDGFTWIYDVSDFRTILYDSVRIEYRVPNTGKTQYELLDLQFIMIKGTPPRDIIKIENVWNGEFRFGDTKDPIDSHLQPVTINLLPNVRMTRLRVTASGDGWGGSTGCAEFCQKRHWIDVNGMTRFNWTVWRDDCALNPLYPQGGTWIYNRSNWCPGAEIKTIGYELTSYVSGSQVKIDYNVESYVYPEDGQFWPSYTIETQLVSYGLPNFTLDAAIENIIAPNTYEFYRRFNPSCARPRVVIQNTGSTPLTSLDITYSPVGGNTNTFRWTGNLSFFEKKEIDLPAFNWGNYGAENLFTVTISKPNGGVDQYAENNRRTVRFEPVPVYMQSLIVNFKTNNAASENLWEMLDSQGQRVTARFNMANNTTYRDTLRLQPGCYEFVLRDAGEDGISFWANNDGTGSIQFRLVGGGLFKTLNPDFGRETRMQFMIENPTDVAQVDQTPLHFHLYPNPAAGNIGIQFSLDKRSAIRFEIYDLLGKKVKEILEKEYSAGSYNEYFDLSDLRSGTYIVAMFDGGRILRKVKVSLVK